MATKGGLLSDLQLKHWIEAAVPLTASDGGGLMFSLSGAGNATPPVRKRLMLTRTELQLLLNAPMRRPNALAIRILLATGVRGEELFTAEWKNVHLDEARWHTVQGGGAA